MKKKSKHELSKYNYKMRPGVNPIKLLWDKLHQHLCKSWKALAYLHWFWCNLGKICFIRLAPGLNHENYFDVTYVKVNVNHDIIHFDAI